MFYLIWTGARFFVADINHHIDCPLLVLTPIFGNSLAHMTSVLLYDVGTNSANTLLLIGFPAQVSVSSMPPGVPSVF